MIFGSWHVSLACIDTQQDVHAVHMSLSRRCHHGSDTCHIRSIWKGTASQEGSYSTALPCSRCSQQGAGVLRETGNVWSVREPVCDGKRQMLALLCTAATIWLQQPPAICI